METCVTTHPRLGPMPRPITHGFFCSGMWRPVQGSLPPWLTKLGVSGPSPLALERVLWTWGGAGEGELGARALSDLSQLT